METEAQFKFEPIWVSVLSLMSLCVVYETVTAFISKPSYDIYGLIFLSFPIIFASLILPMAFKMLAGVPAIQFTHDQLVDNVVGVKVDWNNVELIAISGSYKPFLSIDLKDTKEFYSSIRNPVKRIFIRIFFSIAKGDVPINLAFVSGDNEGIAATARVYWNKHYGIKE